MGPNPSPGLRLWSLARDFSPVGILFVSWEFVSLTGIVPKTVLPSFSSVVTALYDLIITGEIFPHVLASFYRSFTGLGLAVIFGIILGVGMARINWLRRFCEPILILAYPIPKPAIIPLFMIWLGIGDFSKITVIMLGCLVPIVISSYNAGRSVDVNLIWSALSKGTSRKKIIWKVVIPASLPQIGASVRIALAISFIILISSELISSEKGLGFLTFSYGNLGAEDYMIAVIIFLAVTGFLADTLYVFCLKKLLLWHEFGAI
jgi:NitT/TauT family transport system permease protein